MKSKRFLATIILSLAVAALALNVRPAAAQSQRISALGCTSLTVIGTTPNFGGGSLTITVVNLNGDNSATIAMFQDLSFGQSRDYSISLGFSTAASPGDVIQATVSDATGNNPLEATVPAGCSGGGATTPWFNPGDGRITPWPGDRIAIYCNKTGSLANTIAIYGVLDDSTGVPLALIKVSDLVKAGGAGLSISAEPDGNIVIWYQGNNNFYVKWYGGPADASGTGDFRKHFSCIFSL